MQWTMQPLVRLTVILSFVFVATSTSYAAPEDIGVPRDFASTFIPYATVDKRDREPNVVRFMYINPEATESANDRSLPEGTQIVMVERLVETAENGETIFDENGQMIPKEEVYRIVVSEKRPGIGAEYDEDMRIGDWEFGVFQPDGAPWPDVNFAECRECHQRASKTDFTFSVFHNLSKVHNEQRPAEPAKASQFAAQKTPVF